MVVVVVEVEVEVAAAAAAAVVVMPAAAAAAAVVVMPAAAAAGDQHLETQLNRLREEEEAAFKLGELAIDGVRLPHHRRPRALYT